MGIVASRIQFRPARRALVWLCALAGILLPAAAARAQDNPYGAAESRWIDIKNKDGSFRLKPDFHVRQMYDTNIFLEKFNRDRDWITFVEPSVGVEVKTKAVQGRVWYQPTFKEYWHNTDRDVTEHRAEGFLKVKFDPFYVRGGADWSRTFSPIENLAIPLAKATQRTQNAAFGFDHKEWGLELEYDRMSYDLEKSLLDFFDHTSQSVTLRGVVKCSENVTGLVEGTYGETGFEQEVKNDNEFWQVLAGMIWRPSTKVNVSARAGWRSVEYDSEFGAPFQGDFNNPVFSVVLNWTPSTNDKVRVGARRTVQESILSNFIDTYSIDASYSRKLLKGWWITPFTGWADISESTDNALQDHKNFQTYGVNTTYDVSKGFMLEAGWMYREKETDDFGGEYVDTQSFVGARVRF